MSLLSIAELPTFPFYMDGAVNPEHRHLSKFVQVAEAFFFVHYLARNLSSWTDCRGIGGNLTFVGYRLHSRKRSGNWISWRN
jgi:hypothetical protein